MQCKCLHLISYFPTKYACTDIVESIKSNFAVIVLFVLGLQKKTMKSYCNIENTEIYCLHVNILLQDFTFFYPSYYSYSCVSIYDIHIHLMKYVRKNIKITFV